MKYHILVVDDEAVTRTMVSAYFEKQGYSVSQAADGREMQKIMNEQHIDLVLLDINMPGEDGLMLTRELRSKSDVGIILITARTDSIDRIVGLELGADDYCTKPLELRELLVRVRNLLWRISKAYREPEVASSPQDSGKIISFNGWTFDIDRRALNKGNNAVKLTKAEYELLVAFTANPNRVMSRERILNLISHRVDAPNDRTIDVLVRRLRNKIEVEPKKPQLFITVHGEGYLFAGK